MKFEEKIKKLHSALNMIKSKDIDISQPFKKDKTIYDFKEKKKEYHYNTFINSFESLKNSVSELKNMTNSENEKIIEDIIQNIKEMSLEDINKLKQKIDIIASLYSQLEVPKEKKTLLKVPKNLPVEIKEEISADIKELKNCFNSECYRSAVMICGRILETVLFRKYYDATGIDLLEKAPGTGLGNLIAKLREKNVNLDPALTNQIHLINQIRIVSVHKKKELFIPSKNQTQAIILYTLDTLEKMF